MTRLPLDDRGVVGFDGAPYPLSDQCAVRGCGGRDCERHHAWRRSFLIGDWWWVKLPGGEIVGNCINLCSSHHASVTENRAKLEYEDGRYFYTTISAARSELIWQPPFYTSESAYDGLRPFLEDSINAVSDSEVPEKKEDEVWEEHRKTVLAPTLDSSSPPGELPSSPGEPAGTDTPASADISTLCPTCLRTIPKPKIESEIEEKKVRKTWSVSVPKTEQENGAEVLDALIESARDELARAGLPYGDSETAKYYVFSTSLALFVTHAKEIV